MKLKLSLEDSVCKDGWQTSQETSSYTRNNVLLLIWEVQVPPFSGFCNHSKAWQGSRCLSEICRNRRETLRILRQWHEKCVQYNLELMHIAKPK